MTQYNIKEIQNCIVEVANSLSGREQEIILDLLFEYLRFAFNDFLCSGFNNKEKKYEKNS